MYNSMTFYFSFMTADTNNLRHLHAHTVQITAKTFTARECNPVPANLPGRV